MRRLAEGRRSYALSKRLKGAGGAVVCEAKLGGQRVLWTKLRRGERHSILASVHSFGILIRCCGRVYTHAVCECARRRWMKSHRASGAARYAVQAGGAECGL